MLNTTLAHVFAKMIIFPSTENALNALMVSTTIIACAHASPSVGRTPITSMEDATAPMIICSYEENVASALTIAITTKQPKHA